MTHTTTSTHVEEIKQIFNFRNQLSLSPANFLSVYFIKTSCERKSIQHISHSVSCFTPPYIYIEIDSMLFSIRSIELFAVIHLICKSSLLVILLSLSAATSGYLNFRIINMLSNVEVREEREKQRSSTGWNWWIIHEFRNEEKFCWKSSHSSPLRRSTHFPSKFFLLFSTFRSFFNF